MQSCVNDLPLKSRSSDSLDNNRYVEGLFDFVLRAETPVTIGIQGGWGSGKTSLINMLQEKLRENEDNRTICLFVNAWEHSLLRAQVGKTEVTLSLLQGVLEEMEEAIREAKNIPKDLKQHILKKDGFFYKAKQHATVVAACTLGAATNLGLNVLGLDAGDKDHLVLQSSMAKKVRDLRNQLASAVNSIASDPGSPNRFICFIDDLDRVPPETAVEILDITKNIFDIPHCIFVLAIDYEVVVKGLEGKYGKKTDDNEREFRQYFDKIIQIPFTMPVGAYDNQLGRLLEACFTTLGHPFDSIESGTAILENIRTATITATDGNPRSVKRIVNTLSLLQCISGKKPGRSEDKEARLNNLEICFIVISLHINFPEICRRIMETPAFTDWKIAQLKDRWELPADNVDSNKSAAFSETFNEDWKKVVYCLCQKTDWLKAKAMSVVILIDSLRVALQRKRNPAGKSVGLTEDETALLSDVLSDIRVVSVGDAPTSPVDNSSVKTDQITAFCIRLHRGLIEKSGIDGLAPCVEGKYYATGRRTHSFRTYEATIKNDQISTSISFQWTPDGDEFYIACYAPEPHKNKKLFIKELENKCLQHGIFTNNYECYYTYENFPYEKFTTEKPEKYIDDAIKLFHTMCNLTLK